MSIATLDKIAEADQRREKRLSSRSPPPEAAPAHPLLQLQQQIGNRAVQRLVQAKLRVGAPNDRYEREADRVADQIMSRGGSPSPGGLRVGSVEGVGVQAACSNCEEARKRRLGEEPLQRKTKSPDEPALVAPVSHLDVGPIDDPLEKEADMMADHVVRRQVADSDDDERRVPPVQAMANDTASAQATSSGFETALGSARGSGTPLTPQIRDRMEEAFGADFSGVRVHTGQGSAAMSEQIGARAFTYGADIHFNRGEFAPGTDRGMHLLAHELTHVVQQSSAARRVPKGLQAKLLVFGPRSGMPKGDLIHQEGLKTFRATGHNPGLWVEPPVPGANSKMVGRGLQGEPDFYRDNAPDGLPIGIKEGAFEEFTRIRGGIAVAAPRPPATPGGPVRDLPEAPKDIELGDLKPGNSGQEHLGKRQLERYSKGIENTAEAVNKYQEARENAAKVANNRQLARTFSGRWVLKHPPALMERLDVPPSVRTSSSRGVGYGPLAVWEWLGAWKFYASTSMKGSLVVYKSRVGGVWAYEWMPASVSEDIGEDFNLKKLSDRLEHDVKPRLHSDEKPAPKLKGYAAAALQRSRRKPVPRLLQRKPKKQEKFDEQPFLRAYNPWRSDAEKALADPKTRQNEGVLEALTEGKTRTGFDPGIPEIVQERVKGAATIRHWVRYGKLYVWLRKTFDRVYVKLAGFAQKVKEKVKKLAKSASSSGFGNWIKAAALALFKVAKKLGAWAVSKIVDKLLGSLQEGVINIIKQIADAVTPDAVKSKIEEANDLKTQYEQMLQDAQEALENRLFGDKLELFSKLEKYMEIANTISTIVSVVKWGIRVVACASPPLLGCLWNLALAALEYAFSKIMETCWFSQKVFGWVRDSGIQALLDFPTQVAQTIVNKINRDVLPLPTGIGPLFAPIIINHREFDIDCSGDGDGGGGPEPTEEQKALMDLAKQVGDAKFEAFLEMAAKRAADYNVALDAERIKKLGALINSLTIEQMKQLAMNRPTEGVPVPVEEFLKSIATPTQAETARKAARKIDYDKAQRSNASFERKEIGWKPTLFVRPGVASDSKEFADAIFDIQGMLGVKPDGMAGPQTTKAFYEHNRLPKDGAYKNAVANIERAQATAEELKRIKEILSAPYPTSLQLAKDLQSLSANFPASSTSTLSEVGGRKLILATTEGGARIGGYFKEIEITRDGAKKVLLIDVSTFYTLDPIKAGDRYWAELIIGKTLQKGSDFDFPALAFTFAQIPKGVPANSSFEAKNLWRFVQIGP